MSPESVIDLIGTDGASRGADQDADGWPVWYPVLVMLVQTAPGVDCAIDDGLGVIASGDGLGIAPDGEAWLTAPFEA